MCIPEKVIQILTVVLEIQPSTIKALPLSDIPLLDF
jgi:hypothetical protein